MYLLLVVIIFLIDFLLFINLVIVWFNVNLIFWFLNLVFIKFVNSGLRYLFKMWLVLLINVIFFLYILNVFINFVLI